MEAIKSKMFESSLEYSNRVVDTLITHTQNGHLSKVDFDNVIQPAFDTVEYDTVIIYENHIGDYNWFCGGACTAMNLKEKSGNVDVQKIRRVTPLTVGVTVGSKSESSNDYNVALMSPFSGRSKKNEFAAVSTESIEIHLEDGVQKRSFSTHTLHIYLGQ